MFKEQMKALKEWLNVSSLSVTSSSYLLLLHFRGRLSVLKSVSLVMAWQASNSDAYFTVTDHWIEEETPREWVEQEALFGFTQMNTAHNGV